MIAWPYSNETNGNEWEQMYKCQCWDVGRGSNVKLFCSVINFQFSLLHPYPLHSVSLFCALQMKRIPQYKSQAQFLLELFQIKIGKFYQKHVILYEKLIKKNKIRCVCETKMPLIMGNSKDGQGFKDKYLDTSKKILSLKYAHRQYESSNIYY